ncbi:hypothetical protein LCGC14_2016950 [marine sediment metagenome]|uniref:Uncharacterized protein n=1 Tax=marine sediment metagenome TaxID=412755 RepID=A0A0F9HC03_9ZZZZ
MTLLIAIIIGSYIGLMIGTYFGIKYSGYMRPRGLWNLVPFKTGGWKGIDNFIYKCDWAWTDVDFKENPRYRRFE